MNRILPLIAFMALAALLFVGVRMNSGKDTSAIPSPLIGKPAPALNLPELQTPESRMASSELKGRAFVLNVWGSWCVSCRVEHPIITDLAKSGAIVVGYNYKDPPEDAGQHCCEQRTEDDSQVDSLHHISPSGYPFPAH